MALHGIYYDIRPLDFGKFGIVVKTFEHGHWIETDQNTTPWPTADIAEERSYRAACAKAGRYSGNMPVTRVYATRPRHLAGHKGR